MDNIIAEKRKVSDFDQVRLRDHCELIITQDEHEALTIKAGKSLLPRIKAQVREGTLILQIGRNWLERLLIGALTRGRKHVQYHLTMRTIRGLHVSSAIRVLASSIETDRLELRSNGSGKIQMGSLTAKELHVDISGGTELDATGQVGKQVICVTGSSEYRAPELESQEAEVEIHGRGSATLWVNKDLDVTISGSGKVEYYGNAAVYQSISGAGSVLRLDDIACRLKERELLCE